MVMTGYLAEPERLGKPGNFPGFHMEGNRDDRHRLRQVPKCFS